MTDVPVFGKVEQPDQVFDPSAQPIVFGVAFYREGTNEEVVHEFCAVPRQKRTKSMRFARLAKAGASILPGDLIELWDGQVVDGPCAHTRAHDAAQLEVPEAEQAPARTDKERWEAVMYGEEGEDLNIEAAALANTFQWVESQRAERPTRSPSGSTNGSTPPAVTSKAGPSSPASLGTV